MRAVVEEGDEALAARMQHLALSEAALPRHLLTAFYTKKPAGTTTSLVVFSSVFVTPRNIVGEISKETFKKIVVCRY